MIRRITIQDVARYARVSTATVSRVLANSPNVSRETKTRVLEVAAQYGYEPNHIARSLTAKRTNSVGLVVEAIANPFFVEIAQFIEMELTGSDLTMFLMTTNWDPEKELSAVRALLRNRVDGVLLAPISVDSPAVRLLQRWEMPFVLLNIDATSERLPSVSTDNYEGGGLAAQALLRSNAVSIFCLQGFPHQSTFARIEGFKAIIQQESERRPEVQMRIIPDVKTFQEGYDIVPSLLSLDTRTGAARGIFATNDDVALGVIAALCDRGIRVPQQAAVVGYDDIPLASRFQVPLTTVSQPLGEMGHIAAHELISRLNDSSYILTSRVFSPRLIERASTMDST